jgi:predicted dehydrogenase
MIEILVIGYGNIAKKHIRLINKFLPNARFFVKAKNYLLHKNENHVKLIRKLDKYIIKRIKYILICSPSNSHLNYLSKLIKKNQKNFNKKTIGKNISGGNKILFLFTRLEEK